MLTGGGPGRDARQARSRRQSGIALGALVAGLLLLAPAASALSERGHVFSSSFGSGGTGEGQLASPAGVAVNEASGDLYVVDRGNNRVERFGPTGEFLAAWGWGVTNGEKEYEVCNAGEECRAGTPNSGKGAEELKLGKARLVSPEAIAVDNSANAETKGTVYVVAAVVPERTFVYKFSPSGEFEGRVTSKAESESYGRPEGVVVDSNGLVWVEWSSGEVLAYTGGERNKVVHELEAEEEALPPRPGFAVDSAANLYTNFEPGEKFVEETEGLASEEGKGEGGSEPCEPASCFVSKLTSIELRELRLGPGSALRSGIDAGDVTALAVDLANDDLYVDEGGTIAAFSSEGELIQRFGAGHLTKGSGVAVDSQTETVYVADARANRVDVFTPEPAGKPSVDELSATKIGASTATLEALIDPTGATTTATFEYGPSSCATSICTQTPGEAVLGAGFAAKSTTASLVGLNVSTTYHYRAWASNSFGTVTSETEGTFTTQPLAGPFALPDGRAWEMVSPPSKNGAAFEAISEEGGLIQASESGSAITYIATGPDEANPEGNRSPTFTQNLATRVSNAVGAPEWSSKDIAIPNERAQGVAPGHQQEYELFSSELTQSIVQPFGLTAESEPPLSPEATEKTIYLRNSEACAPAPSTCYLPLVTAANDTAATHFGGLSRPNSGIRFITAAPDLRHVLISSEVPLTSEPAATGINLYEWSAGKPATEQLQLVNVLPGGTTPAANAGIGALNGGSASDFLLRRAISNDGRRVFWSAGTHLYMRDMTGGETIQVDAPEAGAQTGGPELPVFQTASSDGSEVFFTDEGRLTADSTASRSAENTDLYVLNVNTGKLTDLTIDVNPGEAAEAAAVRGLVIGADESGSTVYFVANGVLTGSPNARGEAARPGSCVQHHGSPAPPGASCNLYVEHRSGETWQAPELVVLLSNEDLPDWINENQNLTYVTSRVSQGGHYLAFMSERSLTGYDNRDTNPAARGARDEEVFRYDDGSKRLVCVSCDPTGARPSGVHDQESSGEGLGLLVDRIQTWSGHWLAGSVPGWTGSEGENALYQSRYLSDNGRLFFTSTVELVPADVNTKEDVYEYESGGEGSCTGEAGCVALISSGTSAKESAFLDASTSGNDVFLLTAAPLVAADRDSNFDVYDARVCGGAPCVSSATEGATPCATPEQCKSAPASQPTFGAIATTVPQLAGNIQPVSPVVGQVKPKASPTRAQLLAKALRSCRKLRHGRARVACERHAKKRFAAKKVSRSSRRGHSSPRAGGR